MQKIVTHPSTDLECRIECPSCQGSKVTSDFQGTWSCPFCFGKGSVVPLVWDIYWSVRASLQYVSRRSFGDRVVKETTSEKNNPPEIAQFKQRLIKTATECK